MNQYVRLVILSLDEVIAVIQSNWTEDSPKHRFQGHSVGVHSMRLKTFARDTRASGGISCCNCGMEACFFAVETFANGIQPSAHLNLYGIKVGESGPEDILFTHDHTIARSLGGRDHLSNTKTMCNPCNNNKSKLEQRLAEEMKIVREIFGPIKKQKKK